MGQYAILILLTPSFSWNTCHVSTTSRSRDPGVSRIIQNVARYDWFVKNVSNGLGKIACSDGVCFESLDSRDLEFW
jgi:hypothetical protein